MKLQRIFDGAQRRFEAHQRRYNVLRRSGGDVTALLNWRKAHRRWARLAIAKHEGPRLTLVSLLAGLPLPRQD